MPAEQASVPKRFSLRAYVRYLRGGDRQHFYKHLLAALVVVLVTAPWTSGWIVSRFIETALILGLLIAGALAVSGRTAHGIFSVVMGVIMIVVGVLRLSGYEPGWITLAWLLTGIVFYSHVTFILAQDIFSGCERIDSGRLYGAVSVYLLLGLIFANAHFALETVTPGAYQCGSVQCQADYKAPAFLYFSFVTLCSLGYGDILPASRVAGMLAYMEAIAGQMYVAILVARLVGMHLSGPKT